ncbi:AAA family ATPase [Salipiger mangrovisoli]|uniref:Chromosome segregation protein SMC n=1 Tax=Salipiger mangrovisoli TaxID=2865933 RepID=A0ABR9WWK1_9RHOB|nr:ATP-binding protein [Salipiger mangrovisoli]MBE9635665.1 chromosome segregation protein SMC [Salipiger mangrovisoli]
MRLLSVTLSDVRRFARPVTVQGFGPGLNVLSAPNEDGKSTLFDALQALFFIPHRSRAKEIAALRPHAGGAPTISAEIEDDGRSYRLTKRWLSRPMAEVHEGARLVAKGEAAEEWISGLTQPPEDGGPAGLLWVRQGLVALDQGEKREQDHAHRARRDLLSSVAGEVEALTGGRRMERALAQTEAALAELVTASGKPKAGGPLKAAEDELAALGERREALAGTARALEQAIADRRRLRRELTELQDPEAQAARVARLTEARAAAESARAFAERQRRASERVSALEAGRDATAEKAEALARARTAVTEAETRLAGLSDTEAQARKTAAESKSKLAAAETTRDGARAAQRAALKARTEAQEAAQQVRLAAERDALEKRLADARTLAKAETEATAAARGGPDEAAMEALGRAAGDLRVQEELHARTAPRLRLDYASGAAEVLLDGAPLADGTERPLNRPVTLDLPGIGRLALDPGAAAQTGALDQARDAFAAALAATGCEDAAAAREAAQARRKAEARLQESRAALRGIAPEGLRALENALAALPAPRPFTEAPDAEAAAEALSRAEEAQAAAETAFEAARSGDEMARLAEIRALTSREAAEIRLAELRETLPDDPEGAAATLAEARTEAETALAAARAALAEVQGEAPDLASAEATLTRAQDVLDQAAKRQRDLSERKAALDTEISLRAGEGVEEELAATEEALAKARDTAERYGFERDTLVLLKHTLETARSEAREHYFEPVTRELTPLLRLLWPEAELVFDEDSALPRALSRNGQEEPMEVLSGGTREQIALLVRLAFARLLARGGRPAPVILDDALVYTDDARIERMFDALHRQAGDLQILVLTCRQRAFRDLGGRMLGYESGELPEEAR